MTFGIRQATAQFYKKGIETSSYRFWVSISRDQIKAVYVSAVSSLHSEVAEVVASADFSFHEPYL